MASLHTSAGGLVYRGVEIIYGCLVVLVAITYTVARKDFWTPSSGDGKTMLKKASRELWSLAESGEEERSITHKFLKLEHGRTQLHYLVPATPPSDGTNNSLVIFLHGFPDSAHLFARQLRSSLRDKAELVALDLPGFGGSDGLSRYGPDEVLNVVAEAITTLKWRFKQRNGDRNPYCVLVGHDWGGVVGMRLVAETSGLFDRAVIINSLYPAYAHEQIEDRLSRGGQLISSWQLGEAAKVVAPVFRQLGMSGYTYMLTLPYPPGRIIPWLSDGLIKAAHDLEYQHMPTKAPDVEATRLAMAYGPSERECLESNADGMGYGSSVLARSRTLPPGDWEGRCCYYGQGLLRDPWTPSYPGFVQPPERHTSRAGSVRKFNYPVSVIFGLRDVALNPPIMLDGIDQCFFDDPKGEKSTITRLPDCGHWSVLEDAGSQAIEEVLASLLAGR
jgi:pimeloyl-ACP methyl ester carboxylesterase